MAATQGLPVTPADTTPLSPTCNQCVEATGTCFPGPCKWFAASRQAVAPVPATSGYLNKPPLTDIERKSLALSRAMLALQRISRTSTDERTVELALAAVTDVEQLEKPAAPGAVR